MKSSIVKRCRLLLVDTRRVSALEDAFWRGLKEIAASRRVRLSDLVAGIDTKRDNGNLSSAIRLFVLNHYRRRALRDHAMRHSLEHPAQAADRGERSTYRGCRRG